MSLREIMRTYGVSRSSAWLYRRDGVPERRGHNVGEKARAAKITEADVRKILELRGQGFSPKDIADSEKFPLSHQHIDAIIRGTKWGHVFQELRAQVRAVPIMKIKKHIARKGDEHHWEMLRSK